MHDPRLAVMYHYVRPAGSVPAGIRPLRLDDFERQLDDLADHYAIVSPDDYVEPGGRKCLLTFDDGTRDHMDVVLPVLKRRGLTAIFFLLTAPWRTGRLPTAHRVHVLLSESEPEALLVELEARAGRDALGSSEDALDIYSYEDSEPRARVKYALNFALSSDAANALLDDLLPADREAALVREWLVGPGDAQRLRDAGMIVGSHSDTHEAFARLTPDEIESELRTCHAELTAVAGVEPRWFAPPFGASRAPVASRARMVEVLTSLGYHGYCSIEAGPPRREGALWQIGRVDAAKL